MSFGCPGYSLRLIQKQIINRIKKESVLVKLKLLSPVNSVFIHIALHNPKKKKFVLHSAENIKKKH